jgi:glucose/arabinose dehydrogenase
VPPDNPFVEIEGARAELRASGLRNPWRFWIDAPTRQMLIADVGSTSREEVDLASLDGGGLDFGWPCFEGTVEFDTAAVCRSPVPPLLEIPHTDGVCSIIGGVVARDARMPQLAGR